MGAGRVPEFSLSDGRGGRVGSEGLLGRQEMIVALVHGRGCSPCRELLATLARRDAQRETGGAAVLAVAWEPGLQLQTPGILPVLSDAEGRVAARVAEEVGGEPGEPVLVAADRFGVVLSVRPVHGVAPGALVAEAIEWVAYAQMQCPECGAPAW